MQNAAYLKRCEVLEVLNGRPVEQSGLRCEGRAETTGTGRARAGLQARGTAAALIEANMSVQENRVTANARLWAAEWPGSIAETYLRRALGQGICLR